MADEGTTSLTQKIEREMRFTRSLVLLCTGAILGVILLDIKYTMVDLPTERIVPVLMENMPVFHAQWMLLDKTADKRLGVSPGPGTSAPAPVKEEKKEEAK